MARETGRDLAEAPQAGTSRDVVAGVRLSHPDKVLFPKQGLTKSDLATYYEAIAERMLPQISDRPLSLVRCPQGRDSKCFFQKHDQGGFPEALKTVAITEASGQAASYFFIDGLAGLVAGVQVGVLEFHIWGCRRDRLEQPDRLVFDLDPDEALNFADVNRAAMDVRDRLKTLGLKSWAMVTGGKGIHVVIPLARRNGWDEVKDLCPGLCAPACRGRTGPLYRQGEQGQPHGPHLHRLAAQRSGVDGDLPLFHPCARGGSRRYAGELGRTRRPQSRERLHDHEYAPARARYAGPLGRHGGSVAGQEAA